MTVVARLLFLCLLFSHSQAHKTVAGSCFSPKSGHHGSGKDGNGNYTLNIVHYQQHKNHSDVTFEITSTVKRQTFRGFQLICESCDFSELPANSDVQINTRHCRESGRVSHTNNSDKESVLIKARIEASENATTAVSFFVVRTVKDWYGPMYVTINDEGEILNQQDQSTKTDNESNATSTAEDESEEAEDDASRAGIEANRQSTRSEISPKLSCQESSESGFDCMAQLTDYFIVHWSFLDGTVKHAATKQQRVEMLLVVNTPGWASLAFAKVKGKMHPADAVLGWIDEDGTPHIDSYSIVRDDVTDQNGNASLFAIHSISRQDQWLHLRFSKDFDQGNVHIITDSTSFLNYATGKENKLVEHDRRGSVDLNLFTGQTQRVSSRKFYQTHGVLMIIAWIILIPLSMTIARSKWSPRGMGSNGWLELHRGLHLFAVVAVVSALFVAVINFPSVESRTGKVHRLLGILLPIMMTIQICMGICRPAVDNPRHELFAEAHRWGGRCLTGLAAINVLLGISAFHIKLQSDVSTWISVVVLLMFVQLGVALYFEIGPGKRYRQRMEIAELGMVQVPYAQPHESDSDEHYNSG